MNIPIIAADIARRIPEMAKDSAVNNEALIARLLTQERDGVSKEPTPTCLCGATAVWFNGGWRCPNAPHETFKPKRK